MIEPCEVCNDSTPKARKPHRCQECYGTIQTGETYHRLTGVFDGSGFTHKICNDCHALIAEINAGHPFEETVSFGDLCEFASEEGDETLRKYVDIRKKRGAVVKQWMVDRLEGE